MTVRGVEVDGIAYAVVENLGFNPSAGVYAKLLQTKTGPRMAVSSRGGAWRWWGPLDRTAPLRRSTS